MSDKLKCPTCGNDYGYIEPVMRNNVLDEVKKLFVDSNRRWNRAEIDYAIEKLKK